MGHKREVEALQQSHTPQLKQLEAASKASEDQWRAREAKWETERKSLQDRLLKAPKPQAGSGTVAGVSDERDTAGTTRYLREAAGALRGSLTSAMTALQCASWLIGTLGKEKGSGVTPCCSGSVQPIAGKVQCRGYRAWGGVVVVKVRRKE